MTHDDLVLTEHSGAVLFARLNRPAVRNALNLAMIQDLRAVLRATKEDAGVRVVVLGSATPTAFSAGMDVTEVQAGNLETDDRLYDLQWELESFPKPLVGAFSGFVLGGGAEVALSADIRIGSPDTTFSFPATGYGLAQGSWHLIEAVGWSRAKELVLTGRLVGGEESLRLGLLHELHDAPDERAMDVAHDVAERSPTSLETVKRLFLEAGGRSVEERFRAESRFNSQALRGTEVLERMSRRWASRRAAVAGTNPDQGE